jgi:Tfp pilus assembly protein FimT
MRKANQRGATFGFTLIEIGIVIALVAVLTSLGVVAFNNLSNTAKMKNIAGDFAGTLAHAHSRAMARQRAQLVVIDAVPGTNKNFGFYHYEDAKPTPNINDSTAINTIVTSMTLSQASSAPSPYVLLWVDEGYQNTDQFLRATNAWGGTLPFPFASLSTNTAFGCSFCSSVGRGAVAFLPTGRAIFSDGNALGGLVMFQNLSASGSGKTGVAISATGFVQKLVP